MLIGGALMLWQGTGRHTPQGVALLVAIGVLAVVAQMLMTRAYTVGSTLANAVLQYLGILFAFVYGVLLFGEAITLAGAGGVVLIVVAGLMTSVARSHSPEPPDTRGRHPGDA
jgi:drug/metabolite transporter (DMT)-like permease